MKKKIRNLYFAFILIFVLASCSNAKKIPYLQEETNRYTIQDKDIIIYDARILPNDLLTITVNATDREAGIAFNLLYPTASITGGSTIGPQALQKYLVDNDGYINFPTVGKLYVKNLTRREAESLVLEKISSNFKEMPIIIVSFADYKVSVVGEVGHPGTFRVENEKVNIFQALSLAGDMTIWGKRENVKIIREHGNGKKEVIQINLNDPNIIHSPNYYLQQNDVVYVEPNKVKAKNSEIGTMTTLFVSSISIVISISNLLLNILKK